ncbi:hypothetical protein [Mediterranea massiliensis]|uniref:hypothetical protein n=1 Tax=Mediterranea massiliensis TaxID=1841865 RepID=UPI00093353A8|nr:hypothetical protein [Mediterranea massiliensis]
MNKIIQSIPLLLCIAVFVACQQEESLPGGNDKMVTLTLNIGTQTIGVSTREDDPNVLPYEGIRTLRALVISDAAAPEDRKILYNQKHVIDGNTSPTSATLSPSLTLENIPVGKASIYLIANEESIGIEYTNDILMTPAYINDSKLLLLDEGWTHFPKRYEEIAEHGLPMSGKAEGIEITSDMQAISIKLERTVVKLHLTIENATSDNLTLRWVKFGSFISDRVFLFRQSQLDIPESTIYTDLRYPKDEIETLDVVLAVGAATDWQPVYIYPNFAYKNPTGPNPYTLSLATSYKEYSPSLIGSDINSMVRNTQFNILARITASATINILYSFVPWEENEVNVPSFN